MISFLIRYYFDELSNPVVLTPVFLSFFTVFGFFLGGSLSVHLLFTLVSLNIVCVYFFEFQKKHQNMFALFPIPNKTFVAAQYLFLSGIAVIYCTYSVFIGVFFKSFIEKQLVFPSFTHWLIILCVNFTLLALYMILQMTKFQFIMGILPFLFPLFISMGTYDFEQLVDSIGVVVTVAVLCYAISILISSNFYARGEIQ